MKVIVLAGGFATRLWPITESRAKPLLVIDGQTILARLLKPVLESDSFSAADIYLCTNQKFQANFKNELKNLNCEDINIFCEDAAKEGEKLGALGAISAVIDHYKIKEDLLVLAGDNILTAFDPEKMQVGPSEAKITVRAVEDLHAARKFGVVELGKNGEVLGFEEKPEKPKSIIVSAGFLSLGRDLLPILQKFALKEPDALGGIFPELLGNNIKVSAYETSGDWFDVGSFDTYLEAHKTLQAKSKNIHKSVKEKNNTYGGKVFVAQKVILEDSTLVDTILYPGSTIKNCQLSNCVIDENCHLENLDLSYKVIRQNTKLIG